jgi:hypothetical protein
MARKASLLSAKSLNQDCCCRYLQSKKESHARITLFCETLHAVLMLSDELSKNHW